MPGNVGACCQFLQIAALGAIACYNYFQFNPLLPDLAKGFDKNINTLSMNQPSRGQDLGHRQLIRSSRCLEPIQQI